MPKYKVILERPATAYCTVIVEADDAEAAEAAVEAGGGQTVEIEAIEHEGEAWQLSCLATTEIR